MVAAAIMLSKAENKTMYTAWSRILVIPIYKYIYISRAVGLWKAVAARHGSSRAVPKGILSMSKPRSEHTAEVRSQPPGCRYNRSIAVTAAGRGAAGV